MSLDRTTMLLYEYGESAPISDRVSLEGFLNEIWRQSRDAGVDEGAEDEGSRPGYQPFVSFDGHLIRAKNYVGFLKSGDNLIEIFPKVFGGLADTGVNRELMLRHIFYWLSYCRKWSFPYSRLSLDELDVDSFPELIINLIANQLLEAVSENPFSRYEPFEEALLTPRGSINFGRYITQSLGRGHFHQLQCDHEPFLFDNQVNRIIKYSARLLLGATRLSENLRLLQEVTFILSDVTDVAISKSELDRLVINPFFAGYVSVLDSCRMVINQTLYSTNSYDLPHWALLFPMEYIFEDFIAGFLQQHFGQVCKIEYQKSDMYVSDTPKAFQMRHDIFVTVDDRTVIIDPKYKLRQYHSGDPKKGINQADMYQMVTYAARRGCKDVLLLYPNRFGTFASDVQQQPDTFIVSLSGDIPSPITIRAYEVPFCSFVWARREETMKRLLWRALSIGSD